MISMTILMILLLLYFIYDRIHVDNYRIRHSTGAVQFRLALQTDMTIWCTNRNFLDKKRCRRKKVDKQIPLLAFV